jgi:hypothetical protein
MSSDALIFESQMRAQKFTIENHEGTIKARDTEIVSLKAIIAQLEEKNKDLDARLQEQESIR